MKVLFIHNALAEYRIECFRLMSKQCNIQFLIVSRSTASKIYNLSFSVGKDLNVDYLEDIGGWMKLPTYIHNGKYDVVVLPPADTFKDLWVGYVALHSVPKTTRVVYWTEKWEADRNKQPLKKWLKNRLHAFAIKTLTNRSDTCVAASICTKRYFMEKLGVSEEKIIVLPHSNISPKCEEKIDLKRMYGMPDDAKIVLFLGRLVPRKGCDLLILAFEKIVRKYSQAYLLIAGDGECLKELEELVEARQIPHVVFAGKIEPAKRAIYYEQSVVSCLPSYSYQGIIEAYGLTVNESLEQGTPAVTTTAVGAGHELHDGQTVIMVEENNVAALENALCFFLNTKDREQLSILCKEKFKKYDVKRMADNFCKSFER